MHETVCTIRSLWQLCQHLRLLSMCCPTSTSTSIKSSLMGSSICFCNVDFLCCYWPRWRQCRVQNRKAATETISIATVGQRLRIVITIRNEACSCMTQPISNGALHTSYWLFYCNWSAIWLWRDSNKLNNSWRKRYCWLYACKMAATYRNLQLTLTIFSMVWLVISLWITASWDATSSFWILTTGMAGRNEVLYGSSTLVRYFSYTQISAKSLQTTVLLKGVNWLAHTF